MYFRFFFIFAAIGGAIGPLLVVGLPKSFASSGQDAGTALLWLHGFAQAVQHGHWWPRWLFEGNRGFGCPAFFFYPPGAYWAATALQRATGLTDPGALVAAAVLWRVGATTAAYAWLRTGATRQAALASTALLSLQTYNMLVNPLVRFAFAEIAGTCLMLVALRASVSQRKLLWVPLAFAALVLTHLPTAVLASGVLPAWTLITGRTLSAALRDAAGVLLGCLAGAGIAGAYLVPALALLPEINTAGWSTGGLTTWTGHFLLDTWSPSKAPVQFFLMNAGLLAMIACGTALACYGRRQAPPFMDKQFTAAAIGLAVLCLMMTRLSWPVWTLLPILQRVQFPWRLMPYATAVWAMLMAVRLDVLAAARVGGGGRIVACFSLLFAMAALWIPFSVVTASLPSLARYEWTRLQLVQPGPRPLPTENPPEYAPRNAAEAGWKADDPTTDTILHQRLFQSRAIAPELRITIDLATGLHAEGKLVQPAEVVLPQFSFPGWMVSGIPDQVLPMNDPGTGLLRLALPAGPVNLSVTRTVTGPERLALQLHFALQM